MRTTSSTGLSEAAASSPEGSSKRFEALQNESISNLWIEWCLGYGESISIHGLGNFSRKMHGAMRLDQKVRERERGWTK